MCTGSRQYISKTDRYQFLPKRASSVIQWTVINGFNTSISLSNLVPIWVDRLPIFLSLWYDCMTRLGIELQSPVLMEYCTIKLPVRSKVGSPQRRTRWSIAMGSINRLRMTELLLCFALLYIIATNGMSLDKSRKASQYIMINVYMDTKNKGYQL